ncbi:MAG: hypothetical protein ACLVI9_01560 [Anaerostipes hadrus]
MKDRLMQWIIALIKLDRSYFLKIWKEGTMHTKTNEKERGTTMEIKEAVIKAQNGDQSAFSFLYEETYKSKYYLALKYMKIKKPQKMCCKMLI